MAVSRLLSVQRTIPSHTSANGFSLLELVVTVSVFIIVSATSFSVTTGIYNQRTLRHTSTELMRLIDTAAIRSISTGKDLVVRYDSARRVVQVIEKYPVEQVERAIASTLKIPRNITLKFSSGLQEPEVALYRSGVTSPATIQLIASPEQRCKITQALRGLRRLECV